MIKRRMKSFNLKLRTAPGIGIPDNHQFQTTRGFLPIYILPFTYISQDFFPMKILFQRFISKNQM